MRNILIIANTYYQLIVAIQLSKTILKEDKVHLLLSDHSNNSKEICKRIKDEDVFFDAGYIESKGKLRNRKINKKIMDLFLIASGKENDYYHYLWNLERTKDYYFDEIIVYNFGIDTIGIYTSLYEKNKNIKISLYEEGLLSYGYYPEKTITRKLINLLRKVQHKKSIWAALQNFYCFYPEAYKGVLTPQKVPVISNNSNCSSILKKIFRTENLDYKEKYIFFTSVYDFEGGEPIGEFKVLEKVAERVGKDNLLVKMHPRDTRSIFRDKGYRIDLNSSIPWEVIQLSADFSEKVFLTATSGSVLAGSLISTSPVKTYYMFKLCDISKNIKAQESAESIVQILGNKSFLGDYNNIIIAEKIEDIL